MKEAIISPERKVEIIDSPIPTINDNQVLIKVEVSGTNPKDWKHPEWMSKSMNSGDDIAGIVAAVGKNVYEFKPGDRVMAFHEIDAPAGSFAEYAVAWAYTTVNIPNNISFEEAATLPLAYLTSAIALYQSLALPEPWSPEKPDGEAKLPILIYGASSATGAFAAQLARLSGLKPIVGVAGKASDFAKQYCDHVVDYRNGEDTLVKDAQAALQREGLEPKFKYVYDAVSQNGSHEAIARLIDARSGHVTQLLPAGKFAKSGSEFKYPDGVKSDESWVLTCHDNRKMFALLMMRYLAQMLQQGDFKPQPYEVLGGGLEGIAEGLKRLSEGQASAVKYVYRVPDTPGAGKDVLKSS